MKYFSIFFLSMLLSGSLYAKVDLVDYVLKYNCVTNLYDVKIKILEGSASTIPDRAQFNSQISFAVPTGEVVQIIERYMPLTNNQNYNSTTPMNWMLGTPVISPAAQPENDFYAVIPSLSPAAFYNDIEEGDLITLFSIQVGSSGEYDSSVRFFDNDTDPDYSAPGMNGANYSNGFTIGGPMNLYNDNVHQSCVTGIKEQGLININVFPNPASSILNIHSDEAILNIEIHALSGKILLSKSLVAEKQFTTNIVDLPKGVYTILVQTTSKTMTQKVIKI